MLFVLAYVDALTSISKTSIRNLNVSGRFENFGFDQLLTQSFSKLIVFQDGSYLELIAFIDDDPKHRVGHWWGDKGWGIIDFAFTLKEGELTSQFLLCNSIALQVFETLRTELFVLLLSILFCH